MELKVKTGRELQHFIEYLRDFSNLYVNKSEWHKGFWYITLSDGSKYSLSEEFWTQTQKLVPRFNELRRIVQ